METNIDLSHVAVDVVKELMKDVHGPMLKSMERLILLVERDKLGGDRGIHIGKK